VGVTSTERRSVAGTLDAGAARDMVVVLERVVDEAYLVEERRRRGDGVPPPPDLHRS
jgi:hypothetical protein